MSHAETTQWHLPVEAELLRVEQIHQLAEVIHDLIVRLITPVAQCMVHCLPESSSNTLRSGIIGEVRPSHSRDNNGKAKYVIITSNTRGGWIEAL